MGKFIATKVFTAYLGPVDNIPIEKKLCTYYAANRETIILETNNSIYLCDNMDDLLINPIQSGELVVRVNTRPKCYYMDDPSAQLVSFLDGTTIPVLYDGVLLYLRIIILSKYLVQNCRRLKLSSRDPWDTFLLNSHFLIWNH